MRLMFDSTNWNAIPTNAQLVAGYVPPSGFTWPQSAWDRFPNSVHVRITPQASTTGVGVQVLDVEQGDATPAQAPGWVARQRSLGQDPTIYCSASLWPTVQRAFAAAGVAQPHYWIAAYPGGGPTALPTLNGTTAVAHQYADPATSGGDYDLSVVADYWPGVDQGGMMSDFDTQVTIKDVSGDVLTTTSYGFMLQNLYSKAFWAGGTPPWDGPAMYQLMKDASAKLDALSAAVSAASAQEASDHAADLTALTAEQAALLAQILPAIKAAGGASVTEAQVAEIEAALVKALPGYTVNITPTAA